MIYLDYNATTPVAAEALEAMLPYFREKYGNAASRTHLPGWDAADAVEKARVQVAGLLLASPQEIVFTSGATEAINLAIKGAFDLALKEGKKHIITVKTEHKAVLDTCRYLEEVRGAEITCLEVDGKGHLNLEELSASIRKDTFLLAAMYVNNETGLIHPVQEIAAICRQHQVLFFCDATQAVGKIQVSPSAAGIDLMAFSGHKIYGPKGVGALYVKDGITIREQQSGGQHERKRRSGTLNVPGIVGLGAAVALVEDCLQEDARRLDRLRDRLERGLMTALAEVSINGDHDNRVPHVSNMLFKHIASEDLMLALSTHVAMSSGSACNAASVRPSHVLTAMGLAADDAMASIRFSLGRPTTETEIDLAIEKITETVNRLRAGA